MNTLLVSARLLFLFFAAHLHAGFYDHLDWKVPKSRTIEKSDYFIVFLVTARHLDYDDSQAMFKTLVKHASGGKNADVGHSWFLLHGFADGKPITVEGGQSGELGIERPKYYDGVINYARYGYADPNPKQKKEPREEPNPVRYLWADVNDGFFQEGSGGFRPTFAVKVDLTRRQFDKIYGFVQPRNYNYRYYSLVGQQCSSYLAKIAHLAGFPVEHQVTMEINPTLKMWGDEVVLWRDPEYSKITFSSPDRIERSLMKAVIDGRAEYALRWYKKDGKRLRRTEITDRRERQRRFWESAVRYPYRLYRAATF